MWWDFNLIFFILFVGKLLGFPLMSMLHFYNWKGIYLQEVMALISASLRSQVSHLF